MRNLVFLAAVTVAVAGCADSPPLQPGQNLAVSAQTELPPPTSADVVQSAQPYVIGPFDKITVSVFGVPDLSGDVQADAGGGVSLPLIGVVAAAGRSPTELSQAIAARLRPYVRNPQVSVNVREATSRTFTVDGQVTEPGIYPVVGNMSLMRAVATAKGAAEFAKLEDVVVFRTVNGQRMAALYNLGAIRRGVYADPAIYSNDVIVVGESKSRRLFKDVLQALPSIATPLVVLLTN